MKKYGVAFLCALTVIVASTANAVWAADQSRLQAALERKVLRVGVQAAFKPWSFRDADGKLIGLDPDLAQDVADTLGVDLELVAVESSNRMQFLQQGKVDILIAGMGDTPERRKVVGAVEPHYFASSANVLAPKGKFKDWPELREIPVCAKQGVSYNKPVEQEFGVILVTFPGATEALQALRNGRCQAYLADDTNISLLLGSGDWSDFEMPLPSRYPTAWAVAVPLEEKDGPTGRFMSGMVYNWHASGRLIELQKKWGFTPIQWFVQMNERLGGNGL